MANDQDALPKDVHDRIFREKILTDSRYTSVTPQERPKLIILGGQPGAGKGTLVKDAIVELEKNVAVVDPDELRDRHPQVRQFRREDPYEWSGRTHADAGAWADELRLASMAEKKNLIYDTTLSSGDWTLTVIDQANARGYDVEVRVVAAHKLESEHGVDERFTRKLDLEGHARYVPEGAREAIYDKVPASLDTIHANSNVPIRIFSREGVEVYDSRTNPRPPGQALEEARFARLQDPAVTQSLRKGWDEQVKWHDELPEQVANKPINDPQVRENLLAQHRKLNVQEGVMTRAEGVATIDELVREGAPPARAPMPEPADPYPRLRGFNLGLAAEAAVTAYEWNETRQRAQVFANTLHNDGAARDAYVRQGAQTGGALVGTAVGAGTAVAVGAGTGGTAVLVTGSAYLFGEAAEHGMELWQKRQVYNIQSEGVDWAFNGRQWLRKDLRADLIDDGQDVTRQQDFAAPPDKARELSAAASAIAVEQALAAVPEPRNPFVLPANDSDAHSLRARDWNYQPDTSQWLREVVTDLDHREMPSKFKTIEADAERAAQLSAQALQIIDGNLRAGPAEIAAQYQRGHKAYGYEQTPAGAMPDAIGPALDPDLLQASDGKHYRRDAQGDWSHEGKAADPHRALELELTRERLLPALEAHRQDLAQMPTWQPPTPEAQDRAALREAYLNRGIDRETRPEDFEASYLAIQRTRADTGLSAANTALALGQDANGQFTPDSPIHHLHFAADGSVQIAATTSPEDITRALADVRARAPDADAPRETPPEHGLKAPTPEQRDAREQALREANRQGLSHDDAQQAVQAAAIGASTRGAASAGTLDPDALRPGDHGDAVELLQYRLDRQGYRGPDGTPIPQTGQYGPETEHAVRQFQTMHGLPATGVADRDTRDAVDHALAAQRERERGELDREPGDTSRSAPALDAAARTVGMPAPGGRSRDDAPEREAETLTRAEVRPATLAETSFDPAIAHRVATRGERDDERQPSADPNPRQAAVDQQAQQAPALMNQPGHPAHAMYAQALSRLERGDLVPAGTMTQEEKSRLAAGVVAQFLAEDKFATRIDGVYASKHNAAGPGIPTSLIPVQGDPATDYCRRASINVEQALHTSLAQSSTIAQTATQAREQALTRQQVLAQQQDQNGPTGPAMRIGPRTLQQGPQGPQGDGGGGDGGGG